MSRSTARLAADLKRALIDLPEETWVGTAPRASKAAPPPALKPAAFPPPRAGEGQGGGPSGAAAPKVMSPLVPKRSPDPEAVAALKKLAAEVLACRKCPLGSSRLNPAFGVGHPAADVMFVGEGPGFDEDHRGEPFVGRAGKLLDQIIASIGLSRETVYIANVVKCHPMLRPAEPESRGNDRPPTPDEMAACRPYLEKQIELIRPRVIVTLGATAAKGLLGTLQGISTLRGRWQEITVGGAPLPVMPTYHPAALLRNPGWKRDVWNDMKELRRFLEKLT